MTQDKAQKRAIRARMTRTGERHTTARHYLLALHRTDPSAPADALPDEDLPPATRDPSPSTRVAEPGMSDEAVLRGTGKSWDEWFALLDAWSGTTRTHPEIARHLYETYGIGGWWAQGVTVGYERARGMRALHERPDGFSASVSKTFPVPVARLYAAFVAEEQRSRWLDGVELRLRTSQPDRSARFDVLTGEGRLVVNFTANGDQKSAAQLQQERLPQAEDVDRWKTLWQEQLARLAAFLDEGDEVIG
jgi:hypothetical protein